MISGSRKSVIHFRSFWIQKSQNPEIRLVHAKGVSRTYQKELGLVKNTHLQDMHEKLLPYNLVFQHVSGAENEVAEGG